MKEKRREKGKKTSARCHTLEFLKLGLPHFTLPVYDENFFRGGGQALVDEGVTIKDA